MNILVTGGGGDIGGEVVSNLCETHSVSILDVQKSPRHSDLPFLEVDLMDANKVKSLVRGFDVVVHLAAIPDPFSDPAELVFRVNCMAIFNILEAIRANNIPRIVYGCSESASGFGIRNRSYKPRYLPIDEEHPSWPHESYGMSKYFGELMCQQYSMAYDLEAISLRYAWAWGGGRNISSWKSILERGSGGGDKDWLGAWVATSDIAQSILKSCEFEFSDGQSLFERFYVTARDNFTDLTTLELIDLNWPDDPPKVLQPELFEVNPKASLFDYRKATRMLGYVPTVDLDVLRERLGVNRV